MTCGKFRFKTFWHATRVANRQHDRDKQTGRSINRPTVYHCPLCGAWHVTSHSS